MIIANICTYMYMYMYINVTTCLMSCALAIIIHISCCNIMFNILTVFPGGRCVC